MPFKSTEGKSVSKLIKTYRNRDMALTSPVVTADTALPTPVAVQYLIVGGGGGGGFNNAGGGGGGGYRTNYTTPTPDCGPPNTGGGGNGVEPAIDPVLVVGTAYAIQVGTGGTGGQQPLGGENTVNGNPSFFHTFTSIGGGGGGGAPNGAAGEAGGSGGGGGYKSFAGGGATGYPGPTAQGYPGGSGNATNAGGGGGGASQGGTGGPSGEGGDGVRSFITGTCTWYGGGGGGGAEPPGSAGGGGNGGGGGGAPVSPNPGPSKAGTVNTGGGGGGGGGGYPNSTGGPGGPGIVVLRVPDAYTASFSPVVTSTTITSVSGFNIYKVTESPSAGTVTFNLA